ncbi:Oxysterol-binding protein-related protein 11 [Folsomia candida]|uniref:Oxysterol-binding protein-related protein 11 n=1 Tax=Folsomia candida TaxID=158441 RepID=A0A226CT19_FOLCA|nr:Oxysterol-binding protein-related protein 11 [Folsomia candida]
MTEAKFAIATRGCPISQSGYFPSRGRLAHLFVHAASGDLYKLRASTPKERQEWITRLRVVAESHFQHYAGSGGSYFPTNASILDAFSKSRDWIDESGKRAIRTWPDVSIGYPISGPTIEVTDGNPSVKATAQATLGSFWRNPLRLPTPAKGPSSNSREAIVVIQSHLVLPLPMNKSLASSYYHQEENHIYNV